MSNYGVQRIFELGYDPKIFTDFDSKQGSGRGSGHLERIGKKYQWIVFYEILARVSDNCKLFDEGNYRWSQQKKYAKYDGPWEPYVRDIDSTIIIKKTQKENYLEKEEESPWWIPCKYQNWKEDLESWKRRFDDFPPIQELITVTDLNGTEWLNLSMNPDWHEPKKLGQDRWEVNGKRVWYDIGSWLVETKDLGKLLKVNHSKGAWKNWSHSISNRYEVFSHEHFWSPASLFFQFNSYHGGNALPTELEDKESGQLIAMAHNTSLYFLWEEEFDCSKDEVIAYHKPALFTSIGLKPSIREGEYLNHQNEVVCFDPSVYEKGPTCLLMRKDHVINILQESGLKLVWIIQGEKQILGSDRSQQPRFEHTVGGLFHMNAKGEILGNMESFINSYDK